MNSHIRNSSKYYLQELLSPWDQQPSKPVLPDCFKAAVDIIKFCAYQIGSEQSESTDVIVG